jgi:predicted O-methyltransferase YrrM
MLSGSLQGSFLSMMSRLLSPRIILEIGTFTGYSAICLAQGLPPEGMLYTIEYDEENAMIAAEFLPRSSRGAQINLIVGDAKDKIPEIKEIFDLVFIDADKEAYNQYLDLITPMTRPGSLVLVDNVLWSGKVLEENMDKKTRALDQFNKSVWLNPHWEVVIWPVRDGISMLRRI